MVSRTQAQSKNVCTVLPRHLPTINLPMSISSLDLECTVCMEPFDLGLRAPMILPCGGAHELCFSCVTILRTTNAAESFRCPTCRMSMAASATVNKNRGLLAALEALQNPVREKLVPQPSTPPHSQQQPPEPSKLLPPPRTDLSLAAETTQAAETAPELPQAPTGLECIDCHRVLPKHAFSKAQLKKKRADGIRCSKCAKVVESVQSSPPQRAPPVEAEAHTEEAPRRRQPRRLADAPAPVDCSFDKILNRAQSLGLMAEAEVDRLTDDMARCALSEAAAIERVRGMVVTAQRAAFAGKRVKICGLARRVELNGCVGRVLGFSNNIILGASADPEAAEGGFTVELEVQTAGAERQVAVPSANLEVVSEEPSAERPPANYSGDTLSACLDESLPEVQTWARASLEKVCTECGKAADASCKRTLSRCGKCRRVQYCSRECQLASWSRGGHKHSCGQPLPTPESVRGCPAEKVQRTLAEFGCASAQVATACMLRIAQAHPVSPEGRRLAKAFGMAAGVASIERAMAHYPSLIGVQLTALPALMLLGERIGVAALLAGDSIALAVGALKQEFPMRPNGWPGQEIVATNALALLKNLYMEEDYAQAEAVKRALVGAGGVPAACRAMTTFPSNPHILAFGIDVIYFSTANEYTAKEQAASEGALALCVAALLRARGGMNDRQRQRCDSASGAVTSGAAVSVHYAAGAIRNITVGDDDKGCRRKQAGVRVGAPAAVSDALRSPEVQAEAEDLEMCLSAMLNLFCKETCAAINEQLNGGVAGLLREGVLPALCNHPRSEQVLALGVSALNTYTLFAKGALKKQLCRQVITDGAVAALVRIVLAHPRHETLLNLSCATLLGWFEALGPTHISDPSGSGPPGPECPIRKLYIQAGVLKAMVRVLKGTTTILNMHELLVRLMQTHPGGREPAVEELSAAVHALGPDTAWFGQAFAMLQRQAD